MKTAKQIHDEHTRRWEDLKARGLVRLSVEPDVEGPDLSWLDDQIAEDLPDASDQERREEWRKRVEAMSDAGWWCLFWECRMHESHEWESSHYVGGCNGDEWKEYTGDAERECLDRFDEMIQDAADALAARATFAG